MKPEEIFEEFKKIAIERMGERATYDTMDRLRDDAIEYVLIEKGLITKDEIDVKTAKKMQEIIKFLKEKSVISPIQKGDVG